MSEDILTGIIEYAKKEIELRIDRAAKKIVGEVITDVMGRLRFETYNRPEHLRTEVVFMFNNKEDKTP